MKQRPFSKSIKDMKKNIKINNKEKNNNKNKKNNKDNKNNNGTPDQPEQSKYTEDKIREKKIKEWKRRNEIQR